MIGFSRICERYGDLEGEELLTPLIRRVFPGRVALVSSFGAESAVLLHMVSRVDPETPVIFLETGKLFEETLDYQRAVCTRLGLKDVRAIRPDESDLAKLDPSGSLWRNNPDLCCHLRKVAPLERALAGFPAWINGRKRFHGGERGRLEVLEQADWRTKINPLANWSRGQILEYFERYDLPPHPLAARGYASIGCVPCTAPARNNEDSRSGRWAQSEKTECGIHWSVSGKPIRVGARA